MIKYSCQYDYFDCRDALRKEQWYNVIKASSSKEAYDKFIKDVGIYRSAVSVTWGFMGSETFWDHVDKASNSDTGKKEVQQNVNLSTDELLNVIIRNQEENIHNQNEQTESLNKIRWAIIALLLFIVGQTIVLKMKLGL
jgi:hypothetical protein